MSGLNLTLNANLQAFKDFAADSLKNTRGGEKTVAMSKEVSGENLGKFTVTKSDVKSRSGELDQLHFWGRTDDMKAANNKTRLDFYNAVLEQFGGDPANIPENVKDAMLLGDSGIDKKNLGALDTAFHTGKPLLARRIDAVIKEIEKDHAKTYGAATFNSFYDEMTTADLGEDIKKNFENTLSKALQDLCKKLTTNANVTGDDMGGFNHCIASRLEEMRALLGDNPKEFKLHADMEKILKKLRDDIAANVTSKADKAIVKTGFNSLIDSFKVERKMDEKIAKVFNTKFVVTYDGKEQPPMSVNDGDQKLADLKAELARLETDNPQNEAKIKEAKNAIKEQVNFLHDKVRRKVMDAAIKTLLNDKEFCALAARKDHGLVTRDDLVADDMEAYNENVENTNGKDTFIKGMGSTSEVLQKFIEKHPGAKICVHVYGDRTYPFCGMLDMHWGSQEEAAVRNANVKTWAGMIGKGLIKPSKKMKDRFEFATDKMDSIRGFTIKTSMNFAGQVKNAKPINVTFLFSSMPCHTKETYSLDADGDYDFLMDCKDLHDDWQVDEADLPQARKFIDTFHGLWKGVWGSDIKDSKEYNPRDMQIALKFLKFSGPNGHFNVFGGDSKAEVLKLLDFVHNNFTSDDIAEKEQEVKLAREKYERSKEKFENLQAALAQAKEKLPAYEKAEQALKEARTAYKNAKEQAKLSNVKFVELPNYKTVNDAVSAAEAELNEALKALQTLGFESSSLDDVIQQAKVQMESNQRILEFDEEELKLATGQMESAEGKDFRAIMEKSNDNYKKVVKIHVHEWITMARATGAEYFLGGPIGTGEFGNDPEFVAEIFAEEFKANGGKMKFLYDMFSTDENSRNLWNAFLNAFEKAGLADRLVGEGENAA